MKRLIQTLSICFLGLASSNTSAQTVEKVFFTNGSVIEGYLAEQRPGVNFTVHSTHADVFAHEDSLLDVTQQRIDVSSLPQAWADWATANNATMSDGSGTYLMLSTLHFRNSTVENVYVKERGVTVKFTDLNERNYTFPWKMLAMTSKNLRPANQHSGIVDVLVMKDGRQFEGQVTEQTPGKGIKIIFDNGQVQSFNYSDIAQIISRPLNNKLTLRQQSRLLDELVLRGSGETLRGIISSRTIGKDYTMQLNSGMTRVVQARDVAVLRKVKNDDYVTAQQRELAEGEVLINGDAKNAYFWNYQTTDAYVLLDQGGASMQAAVGDTIVIEANLGKPMAAIRVAKAQVRSVELINAKGKKSVEQKYVVTLIDLLQAPLAGTREVNDLGYIKYTFALPESGDYIIQIEGKQGYIDIFVAND